jgi:hypothetical protein
VAKWYAAQATGSEIYGHDLMELDLIRAVGSQISGYDSIMRTGKWSPNLDRTQPIQRRKKRRPTRVVNSDAAAPSTVAPSPADDQTTHQRPKYRYEWCKTKLGT